MVKYLVVIIVAVTLIFFGVRYVKFFNSVKTGKQLAATSTPFAFTLPNPQKRLLIIGDSTAVGVGSSDPSGSIAGKFHRDFLGVEIINISRSGAQLAEIATMLDRAEGNFDLILIQGGANDIIYFTPLSKSADQLDMLFKEAKGRAPEVVSITSGDVGLAPMFPWPLNWVYSYRSKIFLDRFKKIAADDGVRFVELYQPRADDLLSQDIARFYAPDGLHLTGDGYEVWYQKILETLGRDNPLRR